jgi:hypothetical protein
MNAARMVMFFFGVFLVILAAWMLFTTTGLSRWVPAGIAGAAILLFIGAAVMGASEKFPSDHHTDVHEGGGTTIVNKKEETRND